MRRLQLSLLLLGATLLACSSPSPSENITNRAGTPPILPGPMEDAIVQCDGPAAEISKLGKLCGYHGWTSWSGDVADMSLAIGPDEGPYLVILGFFVDPNSLGDHAATMKYDVRLVEGPREGDAQEVLEAWSDGISLPGDMITQRAVNAGCDTGTFIAGGALHHGGVTIRVGWNAGSPC
jgi:hypothetical protein